MYPISSGAVMIFRGVTEYFVIVCWRATSAWCSIEMTKSPGTPFCRLLQARPHILNLCVEPAFRSHGYGERMLDEILFRARTSSVREIFLEVRPSNMHALALYKKKGFYQVANRPKYYQAHEGREDASVLAKKLIVES